MNTVRRNNKTNIFILYGIVTFILLSLYFIVINPLPVFDTDDWGHIYRLRLPIPLIRVWNPTRVYPEVVMPIVSYIGSFTLFPLTGNFFRSQSIIHGIFISLILAVYFKEFVLLMYKKVSNSLFHCIFGGVIFFMLHFIIFLHTWGYNRTLFYSYDLCCLYYYTTATAINAILVMRLIATNGAENLFYNSNIIKKILFIIWCYFCLNSNLYSSIVLTAYVSGGLFVEIYRSYKDNSLVIKEFIKNHRISVIIVGYWLVAHVIEKTGMRSGDRVGSISSNFLVTLSNIFSWFTVINAFVLIFTIVVIILWAIKCKKNKTEIIKLSFGLLLTFLYLYLLSVVVNPSYITRCDVIYAVAFWALMGLIICFIKLLSINIKFGLLSILLLVPVLMLGTGAETLFVPVNYGNLSYEKCEAVMNDILDQFKIAEEKGETEIILYVPKFESEDNWPIALYGNVSIGNAVYNHKIIHHKIIVTEMIPSEEKNKILLED